MFFVRHTGYQTAKFDSNTTSDLEVHLNVSSHCSFTLRLHLETANANNNNYYSATHNLQPPSLWSQYYTMAVTPLDKGNYNIILMTYIIRINYNN